MITTIDGLISSVIYLLACYIIFIVGKFVYDILRPKLNVKQELVEKDNLAFAIAHTGYFIGLMFVIGGVIIGPSAGMVNDLIDIGTYGLLGIILLNLAMFINDKVILKKFSTRKEIVEDQNAGTGVVEAASAIATGLILWGSLTGEGGGYLTALVYWFVGQLALILVAYVYNFITPYDVYEHIEADNVAVGVGFAGALVSIGILIRFAILPEFVSWEESLLNAGIDIVIGVVLLPLTRFIADKVLLPGRNLTDEIINQEKPNIGSAIIEAFAYIGGAVFITWVL